MHLRTFVKISAAIAALLIGLLVYGLYRDIGHNDCGLSEPDARTRVIRELERRKWPIAGLGTAVATGTCSYEYDYRAGDKHFSFSVLSTWGQGVKIGWYDYSQDPAPRP